MKNWKTTACAIAMAVVAGMHYYPPLAPFAEPVRDILIALGFYHAADKA